MLWNLCHCVENVEFTCIYIGEKMSELQPILQQVLFTKFFVMDNMDMGSDHTCDLVRIKIEKNESEPCEDNDGHKGSCTPPVEGAYKQDCMDTYNCGLCLTEFYERQQLIEHLNWHIMVDNHKETNDINESVKRYMTNPQFELKSAIIPQGEALNNEYFLTSNKEWPKQDKKEPAEVYRDSLISPKDKEQNQNTKEQKSVCKKNFSLDFLAGTFTKISTRKKYKKREKKEKKPFTCKVCCEIFKTRYLLKVHERSHTGINPYKCVICDRIYSSISSLNLHRQLHTESKEYKCDLCDKAFKAKRNLKRHQIVHKGSKDFVCDVCGKAFLQRGNLKEHQKIHSGVKPFVCEICECTFARSSELTQHVRKHTGKKPFVCEICGSCYRRNIDLKYHNRTHSGERPYSCIPCQKTYFTSSALSLHNKRVHSGDKSGSFFSDQSNYMMFG